MTYVPGTVIAKTVRSEIAKARKAGTLVLPEGCKLSVRSDHNSVEIEIKGVTAEWLYVWGPSPVNGFPQWNWTPEAEKLQKDVEAIRSAGSYCTNADQVGVDYYTRNYYGHTQYDVFIGYPKRAEG